jgi:hypothetical protein
MYRWADETYNPAQLVIFEQLLRHYGYRIAIEKDETAMPAVLPPLQVDLPPAPPMEARRGRGRPKKKPD